MRWPQDTTSSCVAAAAIPGIDATMNGDHAMKQTMHAVALAAALAAPHVFAHGEGGASANHSPRAQPTAAEETPFGRAGDPKKATRTVTVAMCDAMRFDPATIEVRRGETVRFVVRNSGRLLHEMVLGTREGLAEHAELMKRFPEMEHDEPHMLHVKPGSTGEMVLHFTRAGEFRYGCLIPGHYEAGMAGKVKVTK